MYLFYAFSRIRLSRNWFTPCLVNDSWLSCQGFIFTLARTVCEGLWNVAHSTNSSTGQWVASMYIYIVYMYVLIYDIYYIMCIISVYLQTEGFYKTICDSCEFEATSNFDVFVFLSDFPSRRYYRVSSSRTFAKFVTLHQDNQRRYDAMLAQAVCDPHSVRCMFVGTPLGCQAQICPFGHWTFINKNCNKHGFFPSE